MAGHQRRILCAGVVRRRFDSGLPANWLYSTILTFPEEIQNEKLETIKKNGTDTMKALEHRGLVKIELATGEKRCGYVATLIKRQN